MTHPTAGPTVETRGLSKAYGAERAVDDVTLTVAPGECLALVGHNGAGKTTLLKLLLGLTRPTGGTVRVLGAAPGTRAAAAARRRIGFLPENVAFYGAMTGREALAFYARLKGEPVDRGPGLLETVGLARAADKRIKTYSKGMRQRLGLAQALLGAPALLLLDEPTAGLDPALRQKFYELIRRQTEAGTTVLLSSHVLTELEARTDRVAVMTRGRLAACGTLSELRAEAGLPVRVRVAVAERDRPEVAARMRGRADLSRVNGRWVELACSEHEKVRVVQEVTRLGVGVEDIDIEPATLDDIYAHFGGRET